MNKSVLAERIFSLGDYQNIKFSDTITEIPEVVITNPDSMRLLRYLQLVDIEWSYLSYMQLRTKRPQGTLEEALEYVEKERTITFEKLLESLQNK
jgi:hypothetical protein